MSLYLQSQFFQPVSNDERLCLFGLCLIYMTEQNLGTASSNSDATDPGLDLILTLAVRGPQDTPPSPNNTELCVPGWKLMCWFAKPVR